MDKFRYWLSYKLINLAIKVVPDEECKYWIKYGMFIAGTGIEESLENEM